MGKSLRKALERRESGVLIALVALCAVLSAVSASFLTKENVVNILVNNTPLAAMAAGMTIVIITGGIDVSTAGQMMVSATVLGYYVFLPGANVLIAILIAFGAGAVTGALNGFLISRFGIPPLIITLGTNSIYRGLILIVTNGKWIMNFPQWFVQIGKPASGFPMTVAYAVALFILIHLVLKYTSFGRSVYAIGGNSEAAWRAGVNVSKTTFSTYTICGMLCGFAGLLMNTIVGNYQPTGGMGLEMSAIAAAVIGGTNILGGSGTMFGTAVGVLLMSVIENGLVVAHVPTYYQKMVFGLIIIGTVSLDVFRQKRAAQKIKLIDIG